jgi:5-methylcytosine-specific restriction endonuclease McrA
MLSAGLESGLDCNVLVLNKNYMAIRIIGARRAFSLLCRHLAEVVSYEEGSYANYDFQSWCEVSELRRNFEPDNYDWVSTVNIYVAVPRIIRLLFYDRLPRSEVKFNRRNIFARDKNRCQYCGKKQPISELSLDHVVPRSAGGKATWTNIVCACTDTKTSQAQAQPAHPYSLRPSALQQLETIHGQRLLVCRVEVNFQRFAASIPSQHFLQTGQIEVFGGGYVSLRAQRLIGR